MIALTSVGASAHRLDEYLQATLFTVERGRVQGEITLTPGVAAFHFVMAGIDGDKNGVLSESEQRAYGERVLRDVTLTVDGRAVQPAFRQARFPTVEAMREGSGEIRVEFEGVLPRGGGARRKLIFENHHLSGISAYQVNCLVSPDAGLRLGVQSRNDSQSHYELEFEQQAGLFERDEPLEAIGLLGFGVVALLVRRQAAVR